MTTNAGNPVDTVPINSVDAPQLVNGFDDIVASLELGKPTGGIAPSWEEVGSTGIWQYAFSVGDQIQVPSYHFLHSYELNSVFFPHIHFEPKTAMADGDQVKWRFMFRIQKGHNQGAFQTTPYTMDVEYTSAGITPMGQHLLIEHPTGITDAFLAPESISSLVEPDTLMQTNFSRVAATTQEFAGEAYALKADLHAKKDRLVTLNKEPNFYGP